MKKECTVTAKELKDLKRHEKGEYFREKLIEAGFDLAKHYTGELERATGDITYIQEVDDATSET